MPDIYTSKKTAQATKPQPPLAEEIKAELKKERHSLKAIKPPRRKHSNPLSAFCYYPERANFINQDSKEEVVLLLRRHPITNIPWIVTGIAMLLAPLTLSFFPILDFLPQRFQLVAILMWYLITIAFIFEEFLSWFFNVNIITDERVIDVDFVNLIYREMTDASIDRIQDVTVRIGSVIRTIFGYGDVIIQTASEQPHVTFEAVPDPDRVSRILRDLKIQEEIEKIEGRVR